MASILDKIVATKREEIAQGPIAAPLSELKARTKDAPPLRDFLSPGHGERHSADC
ncbi:MAG: hypothetical protein U0894_01055 [Pirellulales bacterium]